MATHHPRTDNRQSQMGHGTRMGFRVASLLAVVGGVAFVAYFIFGPTWSEPENPPADVNTQLEKQVAPPKESVSPSSPAGPPSPPPTNTP